MAWAGPTPWCSRRALSAPPSRPHAGTVRPAAAAPAGSEDHLKAAYHACWPPSTNHGQSHIDCVEDPHDPHKAKTLSDILDCHTFY